MSLTSLECFDKEFRPKKGREWIIRSCHEVLCLWVGLSHVDALVHGTGHSGVLEELLHSGGNVVGIGEALRLRDFLIEKVALKDGVGTDIEDGDES